MGISEFIVNKKTSRQIKRKENIALLKPIVTIFAGNFDNEEDYIIKLLNDRIGSSNKICFSRLELGNHVIKEAADTQEVHKEVIHKEVIHKEVIDGQAAIKDVPVPSLKVLNVKDVIEADEFTMKERNRITAEMENSEYLRESINDYVNEIFNETLRTAYPHRAQISLNFIVVLESMEAAGLASMVEALKHKFLEYFTNGVTIDFYCILDQFGYKNDDAEEERKAFSYLALNEIKNLAGSGIIDMPYILSNYVSTYHLELNSIKDVLTAAALAILIKNGQSVKENAYNELYNDSSFKQESKTTEGDFYSLGYINLKVSEDAIDYIAYKTVFEHIYQDTKKIDMKNILTHLEMEEEHIENVCSPLIQINSFPDQIFYSIIKDRNVKVASMLNNTRGNIIEAIYGKSLNQFMALNSSISEDKLKKLADDRVKKINKELRDMYVDKKYSLAEIYKITQQIEYVLGNLCEKQEQKFQNYYQEFNIWLNGGMEVTDIKAVKDTGEPRAFYIIGRQYLDWLLQLEVSKNTREFLKQFLVQIKQSVTYYNKQSDIVKEAIADLNTDIEVMEQEGLKLCTENLYNYYTNVTNQILTNNIQFDNFERKLNSGICMKEINAEGIYESVIKYCDEHILTDARFEKDISQEMVKRLINFNEYTSVEKIYDFAFETIMQNRRYYASHTEFEEIHQEVCFLVNKDNQFVNSTNVRMQKLKTSRQLKLFFEKYFDGMDVLFMEGCFDINKLFNYTVYEKIYMKMMNADVDTIND